MFITSQRTGQQVSRQEKPIKLAAEEVQWELTSS
jgi:hypothetical protein